MKPKIYLIIGAVLAIIVIAAAVVILSHPAASVPPVQHAQPADPEAQFQQAGALYTKSVNLANAGNYDEALKTADDALALNVSAWIPLIQSNRAGILVMLGRNTEAVTAADAALSGQGNLTTTFSIAYFNKGNALKNLGRIDEAKVAYTKAHQLDPTLVSPI